MDINQKTVAKWKKRESTADRRTGFTVPKSTVLSGEQQAAIVAFANTRRCRSTTAPMLFSHNASAHPLFAAPLSGTPRHQPPAQDRKRKASRFALNSITTAANRYSLPPGCALDR